MFLNWLYTKWGSLQKYGDNVTVFDVPKQNRTNKYSYLLEVRSENIGTWDRYLYGNKTELSDMLVIYQVNTTSIGSRTDFVKINDKGDNKMVLTGKNESFKDSSAEVEFILINNVLNNINNYKMQIEIKDMQITNQNGASISINTEASFFWKFIKWLLGWLPVPPFDEESLTLPDYDLHAFTQDGRHVGVNYTTGNYENQIEGATASGDMLVFEWIFVPDNEKVVFKVSNHDTGEFLKKYPEAANITFDMKYNLNIYHEDNNSVRYSAGVVDHQIAPGEERDYLFNVVKKPDGTYGIIINEPLLPALVEIEPRTLNINSKGKWIEAKIKIPGYSVSQIDLSSIRLNGIIPAETTKKFEEDGKKNSKDSELKVKFNRAQVESIVSPGIVTLYISGKVDGKAFMGNDTIKVIGKNKNDDKEKPEKKNKNKENGAKS